MDVQTTPISQTALENDGLLQVIARLQDAPGADWTPKNLGALTGRDPSNINRTLTRMTDAGLIFRDPTPELTADGREALEALNRARNPDLGTPGVPTGLHAEFIPNPDNPRKDFPEEALELFADSIETKGVIQPLAVAPPNEDGLRIIWAGERRWRAAGIVNARHGDPNRVRIPYIERSRVEFEREEEAAEIALIENGQRANLSTYEEAVALRQVIPSRHRSARAAAKALGMHEKTVQDRLLALEKLQGDDLAAWKAGTSTWRDVRNIIRPPAQADTDPAQMDIEEVSGPAAPMGNQQVPLSRRSDQSLNVADTPDGGPEPVPALSRSERIALIEATHKALTQNAAKTGRAAQVGAYWIDAACSRLKDLGLLVFVQAGGELGWCVMWGEKAYAWFKANLPEVFNADGELAISDGQLALAQAEAATMEWSGPTWSGPGYVTPWLNGFTGAAKVTAEGITRFFREATPAETAPETEEVSDDEDLSESEAVELAQNVADCIEYPDQFPKMLAAAGIRMPLKVGTGSDVGLIFDASGEAILTVDQHGARPTGWVAAVTILVAAAIQECCDGHEVQGEPVKTVIDPDKVKPADIRRSIYPTHLVCFEDGRSFTSLKRHLQITYRMSWSEYLTKWGLPLDYPSVAPATAHTQSQAAHAVVRGLPR